jgi:hypothetical protein
MVSVRCTYIRVDWKGLIGVEHESKHLPCFWGMGPLGRTGAVVGAAAPPYSFHNRVAWILNLPGLLYKSNIVSVAVAEGTRLGGCGWEENRVLGCGWKEHCVGGCGS